MTETQIKRKIVGLYEAIEQYKYDIENTGSPTFIKRLKQGLQDKEKELSNLQGILFVKQKSLI